MSINNFYFEELIDNDIIYDTTANVLLPNLYLADPSKSSYLSEDVFVKYFDVILLKNLKLKPDNSLNICPFKSVYITDYFITLDFVNFTYKIPEILYESIELCKLSNTRFYIIPLRLNLNYKSAHSNLIIVDTELLTIECFEPHGNKFNGTTYKLPYNIEKHIKILINKLFPISIFYNFRNVQNSCPRGLQSKQNSIDSSSSHCLAWSLLFIHLRILNLIYDTSYIIDYLHKNSDVDLDLYIRRYIGYLEKTSHLLERKLYPTLKYNMILSNEELENIKDRITFLLLDYTKLSSILHKTPEDFIKINKYFEELISYHKIQNFDNIFFNFFNKDSNNNYDLLQPKHNKELTLDNSSNDLFDDNSDDLFDDNSDDLFDDLFDDNSDDNKNRKRKASASPIISEFSADVSDDSEDSHLNNIYSNYN